MGGIPGNLRILAHKSGIVHADGTLLGAASPRRIRQGGEAGRASLCVADSVVGVSSYLFGGAPVPGFSPTSNPNPNLKWESTTENNLALDYGFLNNRFTGSLEYYVKNTNDLLLTVNVPQPAVASTRLENVGSVRNKGVEFSLDGQVFNRPNNNWTAGIVFAHNNNNVVNLGPYSSLSSGTISGQGQS